MRDGLPVTTQPGRYSADDLIRRAREEWQALFQMSYHGDGNGGWYADLTEDGVAEIRNLIRELAAMLVTERWASLDA